jgi:hypothetical protein
MLISVMCAAKRKVVESVTRSPALTPRSEPAGARMSAPPTEASTMPTRFSRLGRARQTT